MKYLIPTGNLFDDFCFTQKSHIVPAGDLIIFNKPKVIVYTNYVVLQS